MDTQKRCKNCGEVLPDARTDQTFCSARCTAQYARDGGQYRERFHAEKPDEGAKQCEECGTWFSFNGYADRDGVREPKYCSGKCRQRAYRKRTGRSNHSQGYDWSEARDNKKSSGKSDKKDTSQGAHSGANSGSNKGTSQEHPKRDKDTSRDDAKKDTLPSRWKSKDPYEILGVLRTFDMKQIKRAWLKLIQQYHPDRCKDVHATRISQAINGAWATIEKQRRHEI